MSRSSPAPPVIREAIRRAMAARGMSQSELARRVGMQPSRICDYLAGRRNLTEANLEHVLTALGLRIR